MAKIADEIVKANRLSKTELEDFDGSVEGLNAYLEKLGLSWQDVEFVGSEYELTDKNDLVDVPIFLIQWMFKNSEEYPDSQYAVVHGIRVNDGSKFVFADGSTGIRDQLETVSTRRTAAGLDASQQGLAVRKGLVRSDYPAGLGRDGKERPAGTTYYLG